VGTVRIGVSRSDPHGMLATPLETVQRSRTASDIDRVLALAAELEAIEFVVGLPLALSGARTASTEDAGAFAQQLADSTDLPVRMVDERLSTVSAQSSLRAAGRTVKNSRIVIDQAAATVILQHALDSERSSDLPAGTLVTSTTGTSR
jgi:putative Holliday junction resolvase